MSKFSSLSTLNLLLAILVVAVAVLIIQHVHQKRTNTSIDSSAAVVENILSRTSIRAYQDQMVEDDKIETLLRAAMAAPSAGNKQPWVFVVVKNRELLDAVPAAIQPAKAVGKAPLAIVVCGDMDKTFPDEGLDYWIEDTSAATENLLLAAHGMGLGAVWCGIYPISERVAFMQELLQLPEHIVPLNIIAIGYPAEKPQTKDKWDASKIHYDRWSESAE